MNERRWRQDVADWVSERADQDFSLSRFVAHLDARLFVYVNFRQSYVPAIVVKEDSILVTVWEKLANSPSFEFPIDWSCIGSLAETVVSTMINNLMRREWEEIIEDNWPKAWERWGVEEWHHKAMRRRKLSGGWPIASD